MRSDTGPADVIQLPGVGEALATTKLLVGKSVRSLTSQDSGYFGPGSVSWRIFSHASYGVSGVAAVLMQALHPIAMAAVDQHSVFRTDAWRRAHMTADYVFTLTFSSRPVAAAAAEKVRRIHRGVSGVDPATGRVHRADEPALLLWVHAIHTEFALRGFAAFGGHLSAEDADRFVAEQTVAAELIGLARDRTPATRQDLRDYIVSVDTLGVTAPARQFADMLLRARMPLTMRPFWALHVSGAVALLPDDVRRSYGFSRWLPRGRLARCLIAAAFWSINYGYLLFRPVRQARARLRQIERGPPAPWAGR